MARYNTVNQVTSTTGATSLTSPSVGLVTTFTGTAPYTVTLPSPVLYLGTTQTFYNATTGTITVSTPSGSILGQGNTGATFPIPSLASLTLASDGTNYVISNREGAAIVATSATLSGQVSLTAGTASSGTGSGSLVVTGGVGVSGAVNAGAASSFAGLSSTSTTTFSPSNASVTISPTGTGTVTISPATAGAINNMSIGATTRSSGAFTTLTANNTVTITSTTGSTTVDTGALQVDGGVGINGNIWVGGTINSNSTSHFKLASGTTAQRPTGSSGYLRFNTSTGDLESYNGSRWHPHTLGFTHTDVASNITAAIWNCYWVDTSAAARTITLPNSGLTKGDTIRFFDLRRTFNSNALTIGRNGQVIQGDAADLTVSTSGAAFDLIYHGTTYGWRIFSV